MLLHFCWTLAVLEQAGSEAFKLPWRALSQKQPKEIGFSTHDATAFCQVRLPDVPSTNIKPGELTLPPSNGLAAPT